MKAILLKITIICTTSLLIFDVATAHEVTHNNAIAFSCSTASADGWKSNAELENGLVDQSIMKDQILRRIAAMKKLKERIEREYKEALTCLDNEIYELYEMQELKDWD